MNQSIQAILLKVIVELKKRKWTPGKEWEITLKSEGHVPLIKHISVSGAMDDDEWRDDIDTNIMLKLVTDDNITYFPECTIYANIVIDGGSSKDIVYRAEIDVAFTDADINDSRKIVECASRIDRFIEEYVQQQYSDYMDNNYQDIQNYKQSDGDPDRDDF